MKSINQAKCRFCGTPLRHVFADLGMSPLSNAILSKHQLNEAESFYPLRAFVCENCFLVQLDEFESPEKIFSDYSYFSSYSESFLTHARHYSDMVMERFHIDHDSFVVELASNDGYLLKNFVEKNIPVLGVEPAQNVADIANKQSVPTTARFFGTKFARELRSRSSKADLIIGNNVLAHVPDLNDFVGGMKLLLKSGGVITMEFPHLRQLIDNNEFDTIYHEHFSYFSFLTVERIFNHHGLTLFDVDEISTHGGSIRIYARHDDDESKPINSCVENLKNQERKLGYNSLNIYKGFNEQVKSTKRAALDFLITQKQKGKSIVGYGAPAKGNTLLNYCAIRTDFIDYTVDRNPHKQGHFLPGTHIPIYSPDKIAQTQPDFVLILPWNIKKEIMAQMSCVHSWGGQFVTLIPQVEIYDNNSVERLSTHSQIA